MNGQFGKYRIVAELGHGGMADVLLAIVDGPRGTGFTKLAVIKRIRRSLAENPEFVAMLIDEARITARLSHPNVVQTFEVGTEGEEYYLALEFLDGQPFHRIQRRAERTKSKLDESFAYAVLLDALAGLHHAHELADYDGTPLSIVHRDINPQNLFVTYEGQVKVVDFGIAKAEGRASETRSGLIKGKVRYMSPEQASGRPVDRRTDVFAVGILLWEAATGKRFWHRDLDEVGISKAVINGDYEPSPRKVNPKVSAAVDAVCKKALAFDADARYATAGEMRTELEAAVGDEVARARRTLGSTVTELFAQERRALRMLIERVVKESDSLRPGSLMRPFDTSSVNPMLIGTLDSYGAVVAPSIAPAGRLDSSDSSVETPRRPMGAIIGLLGVAAAAMAMVVMTWNGAASAEASAREPRYPSTPPKELVTFDVTSVNTSSTSTAPAHWSPTRRAGGAPPMSTDRTPAAPVIAPPVSTSTVIAPAPEMQGNRRAPHGNLDSTLPW